MDNRNFENSIRQGLVQKANEVEPSDAMLSRIINRIQDYEGGKKSMLKDKIQYITMKRLVTVSLCALLAIGGVMFTFSDEVRAATLDVIKMMFVLEKTDNGYEIVEKNPEEVPSTPICSRTSILSDKEITEKMGFNIKFPAELYGGYKFEDKAEGVGIREQVSQEVADQLILHMVDAINDETKFESLSEYSPFRDVFATYINQEGTTIFIGMRSSEGFDALKNPDIVVKTNTDEIKASWDEVVYPDYNHISENGVGKADLYTKPKKIIQSHELRWDFNGIRYALVTYKGMEISLEDAVKIAESFMSAQ